VYRRRVKEAISAAEAQFERWRRRAGLVLAPAALAAVWLSGADSPARRLAGVMAFAALLWLCESIPLAVTALLAAAACVVLGIATPKEAFSAFGNPILFLFVGAFIIAEGMRLHGLGERFAHALGRVARGRLGILCALSLAAFSISIWISNVAATAITLPVALSVAHAEKDRRYSAAMVLAIAYGASVGGIGSKIGTPPNLIGIASLRDLAGIEIGFLRWMSFGIPIAVVMLGVLWIILALRFGLRPGLPASAATLPRRDWSRAEVAVASVFAIAVALWCMPVFLELGPRAGSQWYARHVPEEVAAVAAAALLFLWPIDGDRAALTWDEASRIDWGTILLFGGGILLGDLAGKTGLAAAWGHAFVEATGASSLWGITALVTGVSILLSEATSNTATATLMVPLTIALAKAAGVPPLAPALGATLGASFGFMLPISTGPNAMAYGTGQVTIRQMMSAGIVFDVIGYVIILAGLRILL
jgi:solute carrier family 13 (sodium-dependent dicarboxylate transporter), member 2/3/5